MCCSDHKDTNGLTNLVDLPILRLASFGAVLDESTARTKLDTVIFAETFLADVVVSAADSLQRGRKVSTLFESYPFAS